MATILIIDDSPLSHNAVAIALRARRHLISHAFGLLSALSALNPEPDLILLDYCMPVADGADTITLFRRMGVKAPVIGYTAARIGSVPQFETAMTALGAAAAVRCSDSFSPLVSAVENVLQSLPKPGPSSSTP